MKYSRLLIVLAVGVLGLLVGDCYGDPKSSYSGSYYGLRHHFYKNICRLAEKTVRKITWENVAKNPALAAQLLRMHFHDAFNRGADASILLDSTANNTAEKDAFPNLSLRGFGVIDEIKTQLEYICPGIVSCADIVALAARDAVSYQFNRSMWKVQTGRRDGTVSRASEVILPSPFSDFPTLKKQYADKSLDVQDLVVLSGAHVIGMGACMFFNNRLYDYNGSGKPDPSMDPTYVDYLKTKCNTTTVVPMDPGSNQTFGSHFYANLIQKRGLFQSDAALLTDRRAKKYVYEMSSSEVFFKKFGRSMRRMGAIEVLTGTSGEIRKKCSVINPPNY